MSYNGWARQKCNGLKDEAGRLMTEKLSYKQAGVDIAVADAAKKEIARVIDSSADVRVLNRVGAFASLIDGSFPGFKHPVLVFKTEEPGSKQKLAFKHKRPRSICFDMINHLINDIAVMGAHPVAVQDAIICGKIEPDVVQELVAGMHEACAAQGCTLTGGETSEQPGVVEPGLYILTSSIIGVVEKANIIDGSKIGTGDFILSVASNGLHTNGYSLVRALIERNPALLERDIEGESFLEAILKPHLCYYKGLRELFLLPGLHGLAHITGGGIAGNLNRILGGKYDAIVELPQVKVPRLFSVIKEEGGVDAEDMLRTFNVGVGLTAVVSAEAAAEAAARLEQAGYSSTVIGTIESGSGKVVYSGSLAF